MIGWMSRMDEKQEKIFSKDEQMIHFLTMPREILFENGHLKQHPVKELHKFLDKAVIKKLNEEKIVFQPESRCFCIIVEIDK